MSLKRDKWNLSRKPNVSQLEHGTPILVFGVTVCVFKQCYDVLLQYTINETRATNLPAWASESPFCFFLAF